MRLHEMPADPGRLQKPKRVGRGESSGSGKTSGRGAKGAQSRSGASKRKGFEGGQTPLTRRVPKRGFRNIFAQDVIAVNVERLNAFDEGTVVDPEGLKAKRIVRRRAEKIKILGSGELQKKLTVRAHAFSRAAREKIEAGGGACEVI